jgi:hypothetical protein
LTAIQPFSVSDDSTRSGTHGCALGLVVLDSSFSIFELGANELSNLMISFEFLNGYIKLGSQKVKLLKFQSFNFDLWKNDQRSFFHYKQIF